ncbi:MAG: hypothetical protein E7177_05725 [Erysipelotrichaceae bacterium]|nr:hypothetical protein [Erysipelotrichaceae bacterium]
MKKLFKILICIISSIMMILSFAFIIIEGRLFFSCDWSVYDSPFFSMIRYLSRLLLAIFAFTKSLLEVIYVNKKHSIKEYLFYGDIALVVMSIVILIFSTNYVGVIFLIVSIIGLLTKIICIKNNLEKNILEK